MKLKQGLLLILLLAATLAFERLIGENPTERAAKDRIRRAVNAAEEKLSRPPAPTTLIQTEQFASALAAIDTTGAPAELRQALSNYVATAARHATNVRARGDWDTNTAYAVGDAQKAFREVLTRRRWIP